MDDSFLINEKNISNNEKMNFNINSLNLKIQNMLYTNKTKSNNCLTSLFKKIKTISVEEIYDFYREYILHEDYFERSILASTYLNNDTYFTSENVPYIKKKNSKKFSLVLDFDETIAYFKINTDIETDGMLKLRPDVFTFLREVKKYLKIQDVIHIKM